MERLTNNRDIDFTPECSKVNPLITNGKCPFYNKLKHIEDLLEMYGIEDMENLEQQLAIHS